MPKISIIVPVYNTEKYLQRCIDCILNQTFKDFELILVNDGSTDLSGKIIEDYARKEKRIKTLHIENSGQGAARNRGLDIAAGDYIGFVDSDDWIHKDMYQIMLDTIIKEDCDIVQIKHSIDEEYREYSIVDSYNTYAVNDVKLEFAKCNNFEILEYIFPVNKLYKRCLWEILRFPEGKFAEDLRVTCQLYKQVKKYVKVDQQLYHYYMSPQSSTRGDFKLKKLEDLEAWQEVLTFYSNNYSDIQLTNLKMIFCRRILNYYFRLDYLENVEHYKKELLSEYRKNFFSAIKTDKLNLKEKSVYITFFLLPKLCKKIFKQQLNL